MQSYICVIARPDPADAFGTATGFAYAPDALKVELLSAFYGKGRVLDELNRRGHLGDLASLDPAEMVTEALNLQ